MGTAGDAAPASLPGLEIRPPVGREMSACRMLLPEVVREGYWSEFALALAGPPPRILGAAAYTPGVHPSGLRGWRVALRVARPYRRQGAGAALFRYVTDAARRCRVAALQTGHDPRQEPDVTPFLLARGFTPQDRLATYEVGIDAVADFMGSLRDWLRDRGDIPDEARVVSLREVSLDEVARLHAQYIGGTPQGVLAHLRRAAQGPSADDNRILIVGDTTAGAVLGETADGVSRVDASFVTAPYQGTATQSGWAQVLLLAHCLERGRGLGARRARFSCLGTNRPMTRMVTRLRAEVIGVTEMNVLRLAAPEPAPPQPAAPEGP